MAPTELTKSVDELWMTALNALLMLVMIRMNLSVMTLAITRTASKTKFDCYICVRCIGLPGIKVGRH